MICRPSHARTGPSRMRLAMTGSMCRHWKICVPPWRKPGSTVSLPTDYRMSWLHARPAGKLKGHFWSPSANSADPRRRWHASVHRTLPGGISRLAARSHALRPLRTAVMKTLPAQIEAYVETAPPYISRAEKTQGASLLIISPKPRGKTLLGPLPRHYLNGNYPNPDRPKVLRTLPDCGHLRRRGPAFGRGGPVDRTGGGHQQLRQRRAAEGTGHLQ